MSLSVSNFKDQERDITFINLNHYLNNSFKEYILYITENELILSRADKNKLGLHFIINKLQALEKKFKSNINIKRSLLP